MTTATMKRPAQPAPATTIDEAAPCSHCGSQRLTLTFCSVGLVVRCRDCGAQGPTVDLVPELSLDRVQAAIASWDRRT